MVPMLNSLPRLMAVQLLCTISNAPPRSTHTPDRPADRRRDSLHHTTKRPHSTDPNNPTNNQPINQTVNQPWMPPPFKT